MIDIVQQQLVLVVGNAVTEKYAANKFPGAKMMGVLKDPALVEFMMSSMTVDVLVADKEAATYGETFDQWINRVKRAFPNVDIIVSDKSIEPHKTGDFTDSVVPQILTSQTIVVWSPKGGVGKTFLATNLACAASLATSGRAVLLDLDLYSGDVSVHLDLVEGPTIVEMLPELSELRQDSLDKYAAKHGPSNLNVLCSPRRPELSELVNPGHVKTILSLAEKRWGLLYVDTPPDITSEILGECVEAASKIMLVVTQDIPTLRQTKIALDILRRLGIKEDRVEVVLNRANKESPVPESKVREYLECDLAGSVPEDRKTAERSLFEGKPVVLFNRTEISDALWHLVTYICPGLKKPMGSKKPLRRRRKFIW